MWCCHPVISALRRLRQTGRPWLQHQLDYRRNSQNEFGASQSTARPGLEEKDGGKTKFRKQNDFHGWQGPVLKTMLVFALLCPHTLQAGMCANQSGPCKSPVKYVQHHHCSLKEKGKVREVPGLLEPIEQQLTPGPHTHSWEEPHHNGLSRPCCLFT